MELQLLSLQAIPAPTASSVQGASSGTKKPFLGRCLSFPVFETTPLSTRCRSALGSCQEGENPMCDFKEFLTGNCNARVISFFLKANGWATESSRHLLWWWWVLLQDRGPFCLSHGAERTCCGPESGGNTTVQKSFGIFSLPGMRLWTGTDCHRWLSRRP